MKNTYYYVDTNMGTMKLLKLGTAFTSKGEVATWYKAKECNCTYFVALDSRNNYLESSDIDPRDDFDFIPDRKCKPMPA